MTACSDLTAGIFQSFSMLCKIRYRNLLVPALIEGVTAALEALAPRRVKLFDRVDHFYGLVSSQRIGKEFRG